MPLNFAVINEGDKEAVNIRFELELISNEIEILLDGDEVGKPEAQFPFKLRSINSDSSYRCERHEGKFKLFNHLERLHAKRTLSFDGTVYLQFKKSGSLTAKASLYFDGQPFPIEKKFLINIICRRIELNWDDFYNKLLKKE